MGEKFKIIGGFGSAGAGNRSGRRISTRAGISSSPKERDRRKEKASRNVSLNDNPPKDEFLRYMEAGQCWWCKDGRIFKSLSVHWRKAHGINPQWVRDYLLLPKKHSFISEGTKRLYSERGKRNYDPDKLKYVGGTKELSKFGILAQKKRCDDYVVKIGHKEISKIRKEIFKNLSDESKERHHIGSVKGAKLAGEIMKEKYKDQKLREAVGNKISNTRQKTAKVKKNDYTSIIERATNGETYSSIAKSFGCSREYIGKIVNGEYTKIKECAVYAG